VTSTCSAAVQTRGPVLVRLLQYALAVSGLEVFM